jgi:hypothetical protein
MREEKRVKHHQFRSTEDLKTRERTHVNSFPEWIVSRPESTTFGVEL